MATADCRYCPLNLFRHAVGLETLPLNVRRGLFLLAAAFCLTPWASPGVALGLGIVLALTHENPFHHISKRTAKYLLQASVVLLGFGMNLAVVVHTGSRGLVFAAGTITGTFALGFVLAKLLKIHPTTSTLISAGTAICGGSAIAAVGSVIDAEEAPMSVALGTVFLLNAIALYVFPIIGHALGLSQTQFGTWAGVAIHDVSSVVGAASVYGTSALQTATAVKLSRALWIIPVSIAAAMWYARRRDAAAAAAATTDEATNAKKRKVNIPWFIGLFVLASVARSFVPGVTYVSPWLIDAAHMGLTLTLFLIGAGLSKTTLKSVGVAPMLQGVLLWLFIGGAALAVVMMW